MDGTSLAVVRTFLVFAGLTIFGVVSPFAWDIPSDNATLGAAAIKEILAAREYPESSTFTQRREFIGFSDPGQTFTQVVITLTPAKPRLHGGRKLVVVGGEPGSEYGMDFISTVEGREGPAVWLAKRGVTFVALTRVGRWNFLAPTKDGSWETVPLSQRMPIFERSQTAHWTEADYTVKLGPSGGGAASGMVQRYPRPGSLLEK